MKDAKLFGIIILTLAVVGLGYYFVPRGEVDITAFSPDNALAQEILTDIEALNDAAWDKQLYTDLEDRIKTSKAIYDGHAGISPSTASELMHRLNSAYITVLRAETKKVYRSAKEIRDIYAVNAELRRYDHNGEYQRYEEQTDDLRRASLDLQKLMGYPKDSQWYGKSINYSVDKYLRESPYREEVRDKLVEQMQDYAAKPYLSNCPMVARYIASKQAAMNDHAAMDGLVELAQDRADCQQMSFNNHYYSKCMREIKKKNND